MCYSSVYSIFSSGKMHFYSLFFFPPAIRDLCNQRGLSMSQPCHTSGACTLILVWNRVLPWYHQILMWAPRGVFLKHGIYFIHSRLLILKQLKSHHAMCATFTSCLTFLKARLIIPNKIPELCTKRIKERQRKRDRKSVCVCVHKSSDLAAAKDSSPPIGERWIRWLGMRPGLSLLNSSATERKDAGLCGISWSLKNERGRYYFFFNSQWVNSGAVISC